MTNDEGYEAGLAVRRKVLGQAYVDASIAKADDFTRPLQRYLTEHAWGAVWTRDGVLDHKTRSIVNLAMLAATSHSHELRLHLRAALNNGVTVDEIREILLQVGVYCGAPTCMEAFRDAQQVFKELGIDTGTPTGSAT